MVFLKQLAEKKDAFIQSCGEYGTPHYFMDDAALELNCDELTSSFRERYQNCRFYYPYKTNSIPHLLEIIHNRGIGAEVSSLIEIKLAEKIGVKDAVFNSPGKTSEEIADAIEESVTIIIDNLDELEVIRKASDAAERRPVLGVRLNPLGSGGGEWSRFGISMHEIPQLLSRMSRMGLKLNGLHFHLGSGFDSARIYEVALNKIGKSLRSRVFDGFRDDLKFIDVGGGFGAQGSRHKDIVDHSFKLLERFSGHGRLNYMREYNYSKAESIDSFAGRICNSFEKEIKPAVGDVELWLEPGRRLVSTCMHMLSRVLAVKNNSVVADAGINLLPNALHENYPVFNLSKQSAHRTKTTVYGPLCMSNDRIASQLFGGKPDVGDLLCVMNVGAYNTSWSQQFIKPLAKVISLSKDGLREVRREEDLAYRIGRDVGI
jgi:diaminopimelate decarboxylase